MLTGIGRSFRVGTRGLQVRSMVAVRGMSGEGALGRRKRVEIGVGVAFGSRGVARWLSTYTRHERRRCARR